MIFLDLTLKNDRKDVLFSIRRRDKDQPDKIRPKCKKLNIAGSAGEFWQIEQICKRLFCNISGKESLNKPAV